MFTQLQRDLFAQPAEPFSGEALFDCLADLVFFIISACHQHFVFLKSR